MALPIYIKRYRTHLIFSHVVKTEKAKSWLSLKSALWILWSLGGGIIDLQGMEEVATEQGGKAFQGMPCAQIHTLPHLWKTDCTCLHIMLHTHSCTHLSTLLHTHTLHISRYLLLLLRRKFGVIREVSAAPAFLQFPINILRHPLCTTTTIFLQLPTTRLDLPIGMVIIVVTLREEICGEGQAVASPWTLTEASVNWGNFQKGGILDNRGTRNYGVVEDIWLDRFKYDKWKWVVRYL